MDLIEALRTTGAVRAFTDERVDDATLVTALDNARFAPNGGNAQGWHVVVVKDPEVRRRLRDLYLPGWYDYLAMHAAGLRPWSPVNDPDAELTAVAGTEPAVDRHSGPGDDSAPPAGQDASPHPTCAAGRADVAPACTGWAAG
jgi:nitroreductase